MKIIEPSYQVVAFTEKLIDVIEEAARICYLSEPKLAEGEQIPFRFGYSKEPSPRAQEQDTFIRKIIKMGHLSVLEHGSISVDFVFSRAVSHQLVRHRIASFSQESQRYCNYSKGKFDGEVSFIESPFSEGEEARVVGGPDGECQLPLNKLLVWLMAMQTAEWAYLTLLEMGAKPEQAREVLPNATKTKMRVTANVREWRHIFELRASPHADARMQEIMKPLLADFKVMWPCLFDDIVV